MSVPLQLHESEIFAHGYTETLKIKDKIKAYQLEKINGLT